MFFALFFPYSFGFSVAPRFCQWFLVSTFYNYFTKCNRQELSHIKGGGSPACWCLLFCCLTLFITVFNLPFGRVSEYKDPGFHVTPPNAKPIYLLHNSNIQNSNLYFETIGRFLISKDVRQEEI
ncbi:MAG: hypothetical protein UZ09_BCD002000919 [Bacteroidetes bacterium OLB9]|nr:MAG: hypothetical protein UZ09_BCD002000919 [Bacteroidetes bacterium OLB9]